VAFEFPVPKEKGGGRITGTAGQIETRGENEAELTGGVEIKYRNLRIAAEQIVVHRDTLTVPPSAPTSTWRPKPDRSGTPPPTPSRTSTSRAR